MAKDLLFEADRFEADRFEVALAIDRLARDVGCKLFEPSNTALLLVVEALVHACELAKDAEISDDKRELLEVALAAASNTAFLLSPPKWHSRLVKVGRRGFDELRMAIECVDPLVWVPVAAYLDALRPPGGSGVLRLQIRRLRVERGEGLGVRKNE